MGPLAGIKLIEVAGLGPGPFCGMMLSDMGAEIIAVERPGYGSLPQGPLLRNRHRLVLDLKSRAAAEAVLSLVRNADGMFEGFRPGVAERLGIGPEECLARNPRLVYGRMTGWGQDGPLAQAAGHDINYVALAGALHSIGEKGGKPVPPLNLVGDFGGGGMLLAFGMVCALLEAQRSGKGQVVDAAMVDGTVALMAMFLGFKNLGAFDDRVGTSFLAGAAHYYGTYETKDGKFVAIGSLEPQFYAELIEKAGLDREEFWPYRLGGEKGMDSAAWPRLQARLAEVFKTRTRDEWCAIMEGSEVCFAPVLGLSEAPQHPHNAARHNFIDVEGELHNAPAPRFSRSAPAQPRKAVRIDAENAEMLTRWGLSAAEIDSVLAAAS